MTNARHTLHNHQQNIYNRICNRKTLENHAFFTHYTAEILKKSAQISKILEK